jgi:hypothetical protein
VFADDDHEGRDAHGDDVGDEEHVGETRGDCLFSKSRVSFNCFFSLWCLARGGICSWKRGKRTVSVIVQVGELVTPLGDDTEGILEEGDDDEESANRRDITVSNISNCKHVQRANSLLTA